MRLQDISSVEYLLDVGDIFAFLNLDSNELIEIKKNLGIADKGFHYEPIVRQFATALYVLGG
ncbi:unnamed protein product, partial [Rotaria magnacalcarata]